MRDTPAIEPVPAWFTISPHVAKNGVALRWSATLPHRDEGPVEFEYGLPIRSGTAAEMTQLTAMLRDEAWRITEYVRLHRYDAVAHCRADRHTNRPAKGRALTPDAQQLLANVQRAHAERTT